MDFRDALGAMMSRHGGRAARHGLLAGLVVFLLLIGSGATYAYWSATAAATGQVSAATLTLEATGFTSVNYTFKNHLPLVKTGSFTVKNTTDTTSTTPGNATILLSNAGGDAELLPEIVVYVWQKASAVDCAAASVPAATVARTWGSIPAINVPLAKNASVTYCVRSLAAERGDLGTSSGTAALQPRVSAILKVGDNVSSTAVATTTSQGTEHIYTPAAPDPAKWFFVKTRAAVPLCLDVHSSQTSTSTPLIEFGCKSAADGNLNQQWRFEHAEGNYYEVHPRHATSLRWDNNSSTAENAEVELNTDANSSGQRWQLQQVSAGIFQFVNKASGKCLRAVPTTVTTSMEQGQGACNGTGFTLEEVPVPSDLIAFSCTTVDENRDFARFSWTPNSTKAYTFEVDVDKGSGTSWERIFTAASGTTSLSTGRPDDWDSDWGNDDYNLRVVDSLGTVLNESLRVTVQGNGANRRAVCAGSAVIEFSCSTTGADEDQRVRYSWQPPSSGYIFQADKDRDDHDVEWKTVGTAGADATAVTISGLEPSGSAGRLLGWSDGTYDVRVLDAGSQLVVDTLRIRVDSGGTRWNEYTYLRCG